MVKKQFDYDIKLYNDIVKELYKSYKLTLLEYDDYIRSTGISYTEYKLNKRNKLRILCNKLAKRLDINTLDITLKKLEPS